MNRKLCKVPDKTMPRSKSAAALVPPNFVMTRYLAELSPELAEPLTLLFALRRCTHRVNADLARWLGDDALSPGRMQMLMVLWASAEPVQQADLGRMFGVSRASVSELIEKLEVDGILETIPDAKDQRRVLVQLSANGRSAAAALLQDNARQLAQSFQALSRSEQQTLVTLLDKLCTIS